MKKRILSMLLAMVMVFSLIPVTAFAADDEPVYEIVGENLVANGSFENVAGGMPVGLSEWYNDGTANQHAWGVTAFLETNPENVTDGNNSLYLKSEGVINRVGYEVELEADKTYIFSYKAKGKNVGVMGARINGAYQVGEYGITPNPDTWQTYTYIYESTAAGKVGFEITAVWASMDVYVDEMAVYEVVEVEYGPIGENLLTNGSFETLAGGYPTGLSDWYLTGANDHAWGVKAFLETDPENVTDGSNSLHLQSTSGDLMKIGYSVAVEANKTYILSYKVKGTSGAPVGARIMNDYICTVTPSADEWTTFTHIYESTAAGNLNFEITAGWNAMDVYVDEMAVYEYGKITGAPEPPAVDTTALEAAIAAAEAKNEADYSTASWAAMQTALTAAKAALESTVQADIDAAAQALNDAVAALVAPVYGPIGKNLLTNGSFENVTGSTPNGLYGYYQGGEVSGNQPAWGAKAFLETNAENVTKGNNSIHIKSVDIGHGKYLARVGFELNVEANKTYIFSYKVKGTGGPVGARINGAYYCNVTPSEDEWTTFTHIFESGSTTYTHFEVTAGWEDMDIYVDEMSVYEYGEVIDDGIPDDAKGGKNYVTNGSFEEDNFFKQANAWRGSEVITDAATAKDGKRYVKLTGSDNNPQLAAVALALVPGANFKFSADVKGNIAASANNDGKLYIGMKHYTNSGALIEEEVIPLDFTASADWTTVSAEVTLSDLIGDKSTGGTELYFGYNGDGELYVDNLWFYEVGDPDAGEEPEEEETVIAPEGPNCVMNGSFEDLDGSGKPLGMSFGGSIENAGWGTTATLVTEEGFATDGDNAVKLSLDESGYANVTLHAYVTPGTKYILSMDGRGTSNLSIGGKLEFWRDDSGNAETSYINGEEPDTYAVVNPDSWTSMQYVFTTPAGCNYAQIAIRIPWTTGTLYVDNVSVRRVANNLAENGNFELVENNQATGIKASDGWSGANVSLETEKDNVKEGKYSVKLTADGDDRFWAMVPARNMTPGATYQVSFWMKGDMKDANGNPAIVGYSADLFTDNNGHGMAEFWAGKGEEGQFAVNEEWTYCIGYFTLPNDVVAVTLAMGGYSGATGTIWIDDVRIQKYEEAAVGEIINERIFYYPEDGTGFAELTFSEGYQVADNYTVNAYLMDGEEVLYKEEDLAVVDDYAKFDYDLSLLTEKEHAYTVKAELVGAGGTVVFTLSEDIYVYDRPTHLNENGEFVNDDGTIFNAIFGGWWPAANEFEEGLLLMKEAGVTAIQWSIPEDFDEAIRQLDIMDKLGMKAQVVMYWSMEPAGHPLRREDKIEAMEAVKDHPAIYAWKVADEPNATAHPPEGMTVREIMAESYKFIRSIDMDHPVTYIEADYRYYSQSDDYADIVMIDPYPGTGDYATYTGDRVADIVSKIERPVTMCLQGFNFAGKKPNAVELHSMSYQSYLAGARHTGWYGFYGAGSNNLETDAELYPALNGFYKSGEWDVMFKQYSSGKEPVIASLRDNEVWGDIFEQDGVYYAAVQNRTHGDTSIVIDLDGKDIVGYEALKWSEDVVVNAEVVGGTLIVTLTDTQALLIKLNVKEEEEDTSKFEPDGTPAEKPFDGIVIILGADKDKDNVGTGDSPIRVLAPLAGMAVVAAGALWVSRKRSSK